MTTITLTPDPSTASVDVVVAGAPATVRLYRTDASGVREEMRGSPFTTQGGAVTVVDYEAPLGYVRYSSDDGASAATTLDVSVPWLTHPISPFLSTPVTVNDDTEWSYAPRTYTFDVIARQRPVYTWYKRSSRSGTLSLGYGSQAERGKIRDALDTGAPLLLRYPPGYEHLGTSNYIGVGEVRVRPNGVGSPAGVVEMDYVVVDAPPGASQGGKWTWDDVDDDYATWTLLRQTFTTWRDVVTYDPAGTSRAVNPPTLGA